MQALQMPPRLALLSRDLRDLPNQTLQCGGGPEINFTVGLLIGLWLGATLWGVFAVFVLRQDTQTKAIKEAIKIIEGWIEDDLVPPSASVLHRRLSELVKKEK
jgi:hypothetical protein